MTNRLTMNKHVEPLFVIDKNGLNVLMSGRSLLSTGKYCNYMYAHAAPGRTRRASELPPRIRIIIEVSYRVVRCVLSLPRVVSLTFERVAEQVFLPSQK